MDETPVEPLLDRYWHWQPTVTVEQKEATKEWLLSLPPVPIPSGWEQDTDE